MMLKNRNPKETEISKAEEYLAAYWTCRNVILKQYGSEHFFDLDRVISAEERKLLELLMSRYVEQVKKEECSAA